MAKTGGKSRVGPVRALRRRSRGRAPMRRLWPTLGLALAAAPAAAAPAPPPQVDPAGDAIIVTARRVKEDAQKIPVAVTALSADTIDRLAINTPLDLNKVAGLGGAPIGALNSVNFTIRG